MERNLKGIAANEQLISMKTFASQKLAFTNKTRSNTFGRQGPYTPAFVA